MKHVVYMFVLFLASMFCWAILSAPPFLLFLSGVSFGAGVVILSVEILERK